MRNEDTAKILVGYSRFAKDLRSKLFGECASASGISEWADTISHAPRGVLSVAYGWSVGADDPLITPSSPWSLGASQQAMNGIDDWMEADSCSSDVCVKPCIAWRFPCSFARCCSMAKTPIAEQSPESVIMIQAVATMKYLILSGSVWNQARDGKKFLFQLEIFLEDFPQDASARHDSHNGPVFYDGEVLNVPCEHDAGGVQDGHVRRGRDDRLGHEC